MEHKQLTHATVMLNEAVDLLNIRPGLVYVDATAGGGGHLREIIRRLSGAGTVVGIDRDGLALERLKSDLGVTVRLEQSNFSEIATVLEKLGPGGVTGGILADLGVSSLQLDDPERGFSFLRDGPLDMRMDPAAALTAEHLINNLDERDLANLLFRHGEEKQSRKIAREIVKSRPLSSTGELSAIVCRCLWARRPSAKRRDASHPATRTFQALRIAVNEELASLEMFLPGALDCLAPGARLVLITFHSLEDRLVKQFFRQASTACICPPRQPICTCKHKAELLIMTRKPLAPTAQEVLANPRARSAKLRAGEKLS